MTLLEIAADMAILEVEQQRICQAERILMRAGQLPNLRLQIARARTFFAQLGMRLELAPHYCANDEPAWGPSAA